MKTIARALQTGQGGLLSVFVVLLLWSPVLASPPDEEQERGPGPFAGQLSAADALSALQMSVGLRPAEARVDLDKDGGITSNDSRLILLCVVGRCPPGILAEQNREQCLKYLGQAEELAAQRRWSELSALIDTARSAPLRCTDEGFASLQEQVREADIELDVKLVSDPPSPKVGETAILRAEASGGTGPYTYSWSQAVQGNGETGLFTPTATGYYQLFVEVRDADQAKQTAKIDIQVEQGASVPSEPTPSTQGGPLSVSLHSERTTLAQGESMTIQARVSGGNPPYAYSWSRTVHGAGDAVVFAPTNPGYYQIFVEVRDADQHKVTAQVNVQVQQGQAQGQVGTQQQTQAQPTAPVTTIPDRNPAPSVPEPSGIQSDPSPSPPAPAKPYSIAGDTRARKPRDNIDYEEVGKMISGLNQGLGTRAQEIEAATSTNSTAAPIPETYGKVGFGAQPSDKDGHEDKKHEKPHDGSHPTGQNPGSPPATHPGGLKDVVVNSRTITLSIWDHGTEDNDIVTIKVNGAPISGGSNVTLTKQPKTFQLQLNTGRNEIAIFAVNEGTQPPNTASFKLSNVTQGEQEQKYRINQNESAAFGATVVIP